MKTSRDEPPFNEPPPKRFRVDTINIESSEEEGDISVVVKTTLIRNKTPRTLGSGTAGCRTVFSASEICSFFNGVNLRQIIEDDSGVLMTQYALSLTNEKPALIVTQSKSSVICSFATMVNLFQLDIWGSPENFIKRFIPFTINQEKKGNSDYMWNHCVNLSELYFGTRGVSLGAYNKYFRSMNLNFKPIPLKNINMETFTGYGVVNYSYLDKFGFSTNQSYGHMFAIVNGTVLDSLTKTPMRMVPRIYKVRTKLETKRMDWIQLAPVEGAVPIDFYVHELILIE